MMMWRKAGLRAAPADIVVGDDASPMGDPPSALKFLERDGSIPEALHA